jgi:hypothetical protein
MSIHSAIGATVALGLVLVSLSNVALAQSRTQKKPNVGGKPLMQVRPSSPLKRPMGAVVYSESVAFK